MMGLEVVVRPVVFPNIRPARPRVLATPNNPDQGMVVLGGGSGTFVGTSYSYSYSYSRSKPHKEKKRQVDKKRVYQKDEDGNINKGNFVDIEETKKILLVGGGGEQGTRVGHADASTVASIQSQRQVYGPYVDGDNVEILETNITKIVGQD